MKHTFAACKNCLTITEKDFKDFVQKSDKPVIAYFWTSFCMSCKMFSPQFEKASTQYLDVVFVKVDAGTQEPLAELLEIKAYPCLILFNNGFEEKREYGVMNCESIGHFIKLNQDNG